MRLMRLSIRNTPMGGAPSESARQPTSARRMKLNSMKGWVMASIMRLPLTRFSVPRANLGMLVEGFDQLPRLGEICGREDLAGLAPGHDLARENELTGKCARTRS